MIRFAGFEGDQRVPGSDLPCRAPRCELLSVGWTGDHNVRPKRSESGMLEYAVISSRALRGVVFMDGVQVRVQTQLRLLSKLLSHWHSDV